MGYKRIYVQMAERALGHALPTGAVVHHIDQDRTNNQNGNLVILQSRADHSQLHRRLRILQAGGDPWTQRICATCGLVKDDSAFPNRTKGPKGLATECRRCIADRAHWQFCERTGREQRYETQAERSERNRQMAIRRWQKAGYSYAHV